MHSADPMSSMALRFSRALAQGRAKPPAPPSRESVLVTLLNKRATAQAMGADDLEAILRDQIRWSLPTYRVIDTPGGQQLLAA